eukprot:scaffold53027_cov78-Phaeocystis_antarctica.AAC.1
MCASRKPGTGGGSGTPGDSHLVGLARGQPEVGVHLARAVPGVDPHCPGAGRLTFVRGSNVFFAAYASLQCGCPALTACSAAGARHAAAGRIANTAGGAACARIAAAKAYASTGGSATTAK